MIWAGVQKNIAPSGVAIVIVREDLIGKAAADIPTYLDYQIHADNDSAYNTPNTFSIYVAGEVFKYLKRNGGLAAMNEKNVAKAAKLYDYIDGSGYYKCPVRKEDRSLMNVVFVIGDKDVEKKFVSEAKAAGLTRADTIIADCAEPKSIAELRSMGLTVEACVKGADSVLNGIDILQRYRWNVTRRSTGTRRELLNYKWKVTKDGITTNQPVDCFNHAIDATRYGALARLRVAVRPRGITIRN
jgi:hypothetical protein